MSAHKLSPDERRPRILLVDNETRDLDDFGRALELTGYEVETESDVKQARLRLDEGWFHLAIIDVRLLRQDDKKDLSGLHLARDANPAIPKMILTQFPDWQAVREALGLAATERPPAVDFVFKGEPLETFLERVKVALEKHSDFNPRLEIEWQSGENYSLVERLYPRLRGEQLSEHLVELDDLFRALFGQQQQVRVERRLWDLDERSAFSVLTLDEQRIWRATIVVCGPVDPIREEAELYKYAPQATGAMTTTLHRTKNTTHFAANLYSFAGAAPGETRSLSEVYRGGPAAQFEAALETLLTMTLVDWSQGQLIIEETLTLDELYRECLGVTAELFPPAVLEECLKALAHQMPALSANVERQGEGLTFTLDGQSYTYPDPAAFLYRKYDLGVAVTKLMTPRSLPLESIMTDDGQRVWLTYFRRAGLAPALWNYVELEAAIRFDYVGLVRLPLLHQMEEELVSESFRNLHPNDLNAALQRPVRAIRKIRRLADTGGKQGRPAYHLGILFQAARRLSRFNPNAELTAIELTRPAHLLLAAAMTCRQLTQGEGGLKLLRLDTRAQAVWVGVRRVELPDLEYRILSALAERPGQTYPYAELIKKVYGEDIHPETKMSALRTTISRLRPRIEDDPDEPRYLITDKKVGLHLNLEPAE